jgi:hypothetical protein
LQTAQHKKAAHKCGYNFNTPMTGSASLFGEGLDAFPVPAAGNPCLSECLSVCIKVFIKTKKIMPPGTILFEL